MIEKICNKLTDKIRNKMPEIDDERAEVINYGLQLVIGEIPKTFVLLLIAYVCGVLELSILALLFIMPYRTFSGGVHLKTHIGCIVGSSLFYVGTSLLSKYIILQPIYIKYALIAQANSKKYIICPNVCSEISFSSIKRFGTLPSMFLAIISNIFSIPL